MVLHNENMGDIQEMSISEQQEWVEKKLNDMEKDIVDLPPEFSKAIDDNFWQLL